MRNGWYKKNPKDRIWWYRDNRQYGLHLFSFDRNNLFNLFSDYPQKLSQEQKQLFDKENPFWADFFKDRV